MADCRFCGNTLPLGWKAEWTHARCNKEYELRLVEGRCVFCGAGIGRSINDYPYCRKCMHAAKAPPYVGYPGV